MTQNNILYFFLLILVSSCSNNEKSIKLNERSFSIVNLNQKFPIINLYELNNINDSLGLTCEKCVSEENKKVYPVSIVISKEMRSYEFHTLGLGANYTFQYDKNNRIVNQKVTSCYTWNISYNYLDTLDYIYQLSKVDGDNEIDTTSYKLDFSGRVIEVNGKEYGDLNKRIFSKKISYSQNSSIPDSINSVFKNNNKIAEVRKEIFFQSKDKIDSILIEETKFNSNQVEILKYFNYFDNNEIFNSQKKENLKSPNNIFFVEKLGSK